MEHLLKLSSLTPDEIIHILDVADEYKRLHKAGTDPKDLQGKAVALMFGKHSTRTRTSLEVGIYQMGGLGTYLSAADMQIARGEPIQDTARVLGRYYDAIVYRTFKQSDVDALARYSGVPVVSGMTDYAHPLQVLTDLMTVREYKGKLAGLKAGFVGDGYNMANSLIVGCLMMGNLMKESGVVERITKTAGNELMNIITIFLGFSVGCTTNAATFLNIQTVEIIVLGIVAFGVGTAGGVLLGKVMCFVTHGKINPLIGSAGVSAVPMAARVSQTVGQEANPSNFLLMHAMGPNVAGVVGSAVAAGILLSFLG